MDLQQRFEDSLARFRLPPGRALAAVSGGVDSIVLLDLLARTAEHHRQDLVIAHLDHGLQPVDDPRAIVERAAKRYGLAVEFRALHLPPASSETAARAARLEALKEIAAQRRCQAIFLAHHADDQAETVLMRVTRGSGTAGLRGIARRRGIFLRPLLGFRRSEIVGYATEQGLVWWEDPANRDPRHLRSWLRAEVLPRMEQRLPDLAPRLLRLAAHARRERSAWRQLLTAWPQLQWNKVGGVHTLALQPLREMPDALRLSVLGALAREAGCRAGPARLHAAWMQLTAALSGQRATIGSGWSFELAFDALRLLPPESESLSSPVTLETAKGEVHWGDWRLTWSTEPAPATQERTASVAWFAHGTLMVRALRSGDRLRPLGAPGRRLAVRCFQDARVPRSARATWPILENHGDIAWIPGVCRSDLLLPVAGCDALRVEVAALG